MPSEIIRNHPIEIENTTLLVGVGDLIYHPNYLPSSSNLDKVQINQCVIRLTGAQGRSSFPMTSTINDHNVSKYNGFTVDDSLSTGTFCGPV
jgi:hypothetical protein